MSLDTTHLWHKRARPDPTAENFNVQLGCHAEEFVEMLEAMHFTHPKFGTSAGGDMTLFTMLGEFADELKANRIQAAVVDRNAFLDALADQIVTAVGVGHCASMDVPTALTRVNESNWSKFDDEGQPIFNAAGKIAKGPNYKEPDLSGLF